MDRSKHMPVTNFDSEDGQYFVEAIRDNIHYTFVFVDRGGTGAMLKSMMVDGFKIAPTEGRTKAEAYGEARRQLLEEVEHIEEVYVPSNATVIFDNE